MTLTARTATLAAVLAATTLLTTAPAHAQLVPLHSVDGLALVGPLLGGGGDAAKSLAEAAEDAVDDAT